MSRSISDSSAPLLRTILGLLARGNDAARKSDRKSLVQANEYRLEALELIESIRPKHDDDTIGWSQYSEAMAPAISLGLLIGLRGRTSYSSLQPLLNQASRLIKEQQASQKHISRLLRICGEVALADQRTDEAIGWFRQAIAGLGSDDEIALEAVCALAEIYIRRRDYRSAIHLFGDARRNWLLNQLNGDFLATRPLDASLFLRAADLLVRAYRKNNNHQEAVRWFGYAKNARARQ